LSEILNPCGSWPAGDGGLTVGLFSAEILTPVGAGLPAMAAFERTHFLLMYPSHSALLPTKSTASSPSPLHFTGAYRVVGYKE
ncbi:hypothetical protein ACIP8I_25335, partial [Pseudomonas sp. NPDC088414]|uniref:hypothetical protein n=1 Tax=Pseudomonas sp. NPDC088414 TaxID=3364454 RepID=UPI0037F1FB14